MYQARVILEGRAVRAPSIRVETQEAAGTAIVSKLLCCDGKKFKNYTAPANQKITLWNIGLRENGFSL